MIEHPTSPEGLTVLILRTEYAFIENTHHFLASKEDQHTCQVCFGLKTNFQKKIFIIFRKISFENTQFISKQRVNIQIFQRCSPGNRDLMEIVCALNRQGRPTLLLICTSQDGEIGGNLLQKKISHSHIDTSL